MGSEQVFTTARGVYTVTLLMMTSLLVWVVLAVLLWQPALAQSHVQAVELYQQGKEEEAASIWIQLALNGDATGQYHLGQLYAAGIARPRRGDLATFWFRNASLQGHVGAQYRLGVLYINGNGVPRLREEGLFWLRKASGKNNRSAQFNLALVLEQGNEAEQVESRQWLKRAAIAGHAGAIERRAEQQVSEQQVAGLATESKSRKRLKGVAYIRVLNPDYYTVEITGIDSQQMAEELVESENLKGSLAIYTVGRKQSPVLISGLFKEKREARERADELQDLLNGQGIRIKARTVKSVQKSAEKSARQ